MSYYQKHLFICTNQKANGKKCCQQAEAEAMFQHARTNLSTANKLGLGLCGVSKSGCLGRCAEGPIAVVYPQGTWYTYKDTENIDSITDTMIDSTSLNPVNLLLLPLLDAGK